LDNLDKFYTKKEVVKKCLSLLNFNKYDVIVEPSAGSGAFLDLLPKNKTIALDIEPDIPSIIKMDFFDTSPLNKYKYLVIGNPPFGKNSSLAKRFFNHAATFADTIAFIVPRTFRKASTINQLCLDFHQTHEIFLSKEAFELPDGTSYVVPSIFQIWERKKTKRQKEILPLTHKDFVFLTTEDYDISASVSVTIKVDNQKHIFELDLEQWEQLKIFKKENPFLFSSYKTIRVKRNITWKTMPDFVLRRAGAQAGQLSFDYKKQALEGNYFIKANNNKVVDIFQKMWDTWWCGNSDKEKLSVKWDTAGQACISKAELVQHYEKMKEKINEQK